MGLFPPLQHRYGSVTVYRFTLGLYPIAFAIYPFANLWARSSSGFEVVWALLISSLVLSSFANLAFSSNMILVNAVAPSRQALGTLNGLCHLLSLTLSSAQSQEVGGK